MSKAFINGYEALIYGFRITKNGVKVCDCYIPELDCREEVITALLEVVGDKE